jgi:hypothetical protein
MLVEDQHGVQDAQQIYRTFRPYALDLVATHDVPIDEALLALARAASECPTNLTHFEIGQYVCAQTEQSIVQSKHSGRGLRETG